MLQFQKRSQFLFVEADDEIVADGDNGDSHLARLFNHDFALLNVLGDVMLSIGYVIGLEKLLRRATEVARRG